MKSVFMHTLGSNDGVGFESLEVQMDMGGGPCVELYPLVKCLYT